MPLFHKPSLWDDCFEAKKQTLETMYSAARMRNSDGASVKADTNKYAANDLRLRPALEQGHDLGSAVERYIQGDRRALDMLRGPKD
jgi:hypothetical protein